MKLSLFISITLIIIITYSVVKRNLHIYEISFIWMSLICTFAAVIQILQTNIKGLKIIGNIETVFTVWIVSLFLIPLIIIGCLDLLSGEKSLKNKIILFIMSITFLIGIEYSLVYLKIFKYFKIKLWQSVIFWSLCILGMYILQRGFRKICRREGMPL